MLLGYPPRVPHPLPCKSVGLDANQPNSPQKSRPILLMTLRRRISTSTPARSSAWRPMATAKTSKLFWEETRRKEKWAPYDKNFRNPYLNLKPVQHPQAQQEIPLRPACPACRLCMWGLGSFLTRHTQEQSRAVLSELLSDLRVNLHSTLIPAPPHTSPRPAPPSPPHQTETAPPPSPSSHQSPTHTQSSTASPPHHSPNNPA